MDLDHLHREILSLEGHPGDLGVGLMCDLHAVDPSAEFAGTVRVLGRRSAAPTEADEPTPAPDPGLLAQLHGHADLGALAVFLDSRQGQLSWHWGAAGGFPLRGLLAASFGEALAVAARRPMGPCSRQGCLLGNPLPVPTPWDHPSRPRGVDFLIEALPERDWSLVTWATPVAPAQLESRYTRVMGWLRRIHQLPEREQAHPDIAEARGILERAAAHLVQRRPQGMWRVGTLFLADDDSIFDVGLAALGACFTSNPQAVRPLQARACQDGGRIDPADEWLGSDELARLLQPPRRDWPGFRQVTDVPFDLQVERRSGRTPRRSWRLGPSLLAGEPSGAPVELDLDRLTRHALVAGITGSGKTNTVIHLLLEAWGRHQIPFLVVEPTKTEYRRLLRSLPAAQHGTRVFTAGLEQADTAFPLRMNPLDVPEGTPPGTWIDGLLALMQASFTLYPPMPYVLQAALYRVYERSGWDVVASTRGRTPGMGELVDSCDGLVDELGYDARISADVKAALRARLGTLVQGTRGLAYAAGAQLPDEEIFEHPCVIELDALPRVEDKAFAMGLVVLRLSCWRRFGPRQGPHKPLKHLLVLEEAHRLLRRTAPAGGGGADQGEGGNPRAHGVEQLTDLISEIRAYGEGVIIADQVPVRLAEDAIKNTDLKILHRMVAEDDRELAGQSAAMSPQQREELLRLEPGEAAVYQEPMDRPLLLKFPAVTGYDEPIPGPDALIAQWRSLRHVQPKPYTACIGCPSYRLACGDQLAQARLAADQQDLWRRARSAAFQAVAGLAIPGLRSATREGHPPVGDLCTRATVAHRAARWIADPLGLDDATTASITTMLDAGGHLDIHPTGAGPLAACDACPQACRWRRLGARLAGDGAQWAPNLHRPREAHRGLAPLRSKAAAWAGRPPGSALGPLVFCIAAHELDAATRPDVARQAALAIRRHLDQSGDLP